MLSKYGGKKNSSYCEPRLSERSEESRQGELLICNGCNFRPRFFLSLSRCLSLSVITSIELGQFLAELDVICL